jgi:hypothetical protein
MGFSLGSCGYVFFFIHVLQAITSLSQIKLKAVRVVDKYQKSDNIIFERVGRDFADV